MITSRHLWSLTGVISGLLIVTAIHWPWKPHLAKPHYDLHDKNPAIRAAAVPKLIGSDDERLVIEMLDDEDPDVRLLAVQKLGVDGPGGAALIRMLGDERKMVRREAIVILSYKRPGALAALEAGLQDKNPLIRSGSAQALFIDRYDKEQSYWKKEEAMNVIPILRDLLNDENAEVRENAVKALERINR